jgi:mono/diheme cytochrome c family protein
MIAVRRSGWLLAGLCGLLLAGCQRGRGGAAQPVVPIGQATQRSLQPADLQADARRAVGERIERRERLYRELWQPGSLWSTLRIEQSELDSGRVSLGRAAELGRDLFQLDFDVAHGLGNGLAKRHSPLAGLRPPPNLRHVHYQDFGGPDATRCVACHYVGGVGGAGAKIDNVFFDGDGRTPTSGLERNPRSLAGAAVLQRLAEEMTSELQAEARRLQKSLAVGQGAPLIAKGINFGIARKIVGGRLDLTAVRTVGVDLVVRPFGWKGTESSLRQMVERSLAQHLGIQSEGLLRRSESRGQLGDGPEGDPDDDGQQREATDGMVSALSLYIASLALPTEEAAELPTYLLTSGRGEALFTRIGCASCHVPELPLHDSVVSLGPTPGSAPRVDLAPLLTPPGRSQRQPTVRLYSDLRRHDLGKRLAETRVDHGVSWQLWLTPPLWGIAASGPYLHDGRAGDIDSAIAAHDGEAAAARANYIGLPEEDAAAVRLFLHSLGRPHNLECKP